MGMGRKCRTAAAVWVAVVLLAAGCGDERASSTGEAEVSSGKGGTSTTVSDSGRQASDDSVSAEIVGDPIRECPDASQLDPVVGQPMEIDPDHDPAADEFPAPGFSCRWRVVGLGYGVFGRTTVSLSVTADEFRLMDGFGRLEACATKSDCGDGDGDVYDISRDYARMVSDAQWVVMNVERDAYVDLQTMASSPSGTECYASLLVQDDRELDDATLDTWAARLTEFAANACGMR